MAIEITCRDTESGESQTRTIDGDNYVIVTCGRYFIAHTNVFPRSGTRQITLKIDRNRGKDPGELRPDGESG